MRNSAPGVTRRRDASGCQQLPARLSEENSSSPRGSPTRARAVCTPT